MRKQTKLVAVLSAAALLAMGASMTSFAAGWEKDDAGVWHYYDNGDNMVTDEWKKDGGKWFYLDEDGNMLTDAWVDDDYYVGSDGAMLVNQWIKTAADDENGEPDDDGERWYYFNNKGKKVADDKKKINGKTYYFNPDGEMRYDWYDDNGDWYYLGTEDEGWRAEGQWLWLEEPDNSDDDDNDAKPNHSDDDCGIGCDSEGWYYFQNDGKVYKDSSKKKKVNGKYYYFNKHGQMLYEWINTKDRTGDHVATEAVLDGANNNARKGTATASDMVYYNEVEDGSRTNGWYEIDGAGDLDNDNDTDWYYFKKGEAKKADPTNVHDVQKDSDNNTQYRKKIKINGKYFCFDEDGKMQTGLQRIDGNTYYFDDNGYMKTGKVTADDDNDDTFTFYFSSKNNDTGKGYDGVKDGYLYQDGQRLQADDDYAIYRYVSRDANGVITGSKLYVVNKSGKIQKSTTKAYELDGGVGYAKVSSTGNVTFNTVEKTTTTERYTNPSENVIRTGGYTRYGTTLTDGFVWLP